MLFAVQLDILRFLLHFAVFADPPLSPFPLRASMTDLPKSSSTSTIASNNVPVDSPTKPNRLVALKDRLGAVDDLLISSVLKTAGALPTGASCGVVEERAES